MYIINEDMPSLRDMTDIFIKNSNNIYKEHIVYLDVSYFKTFNSDVIGHILDLTEEGYKELTESIFVDVCVSSILSHKKEIDIFRLVDYTVNMLEDVLTKNGISTEFKKETLKNQILLYMDVFRNNINNVLDKHGFNSHERLSISDFDELEDYNKFYLVHEFNLGVDTFNIRNNTLIIKEYERVG